VSASGVDPTFATRTWGYLRLAMVALVIGLGVSLVIEHAKVTPGCFQPSISAYYYTPVRGYFVGALVALAVCLVCVRGNTAVEDPLLNLAGMFALAVAFVPTPYATACTSVARPIENPAANVANNVLAVLIVGAILLVVAGIVAVRKPATVPARIASAVAGAVWVSATLAFWLARGWFLAHAHDVAATLMFVCIVGAAVDNALDVGRPSLQKLYGAIAVAMSTALIVIPLLGHIIGWGYWTIVVETVLITLFAVFWIVQTWELWKPGLRPRRLAAQRR
jgi:hypothetical protein